MDVSVAYNILKKQGHTTTHISQSLPSNAQDQQNVDSILRGVKFNEPIHNL